MWEKEYFMFNYSEFGEENYDAEYTDIIDYQDVIRSVLNSVDIYIYIWYVTLLASGQFFSPGKTEMDYLVLATVKWEKEVKYE